MDSYSGKRLSGDFESIPALPASRFDPVPCFGEPPLPLPSADDDLFSPGICHPGDVSPTFEKPLTMEKTIEDARFIAQHVKNKDKFENVSFL